MTDPFHAELELARALAVKAGEMALSYGHKNADIQFKDNNLTNPVTAADLAVDAFLKEALTSAFPTYGWLSEETADDAARLDKQRVWIVDPIDGTRGYVSWLENSAKGKAIRNEQQFCISIGLVENGQPVVGVIYVPLTKQLFAVTKDSGFTLNGEPVVLPAPPAKLKETCYLASRTEAEAGMLNFLHNNTSLEVYTSIAYKLALLASGTGHVMGSVKPKNEWDVVAGAFMCTFQGLTVTDLEGKPYTYNNKTPLVKGVVVAPDSLYACLKELMPAEVVSTHY